MRRLSQMVREAAFGDGHAATLALERLEQRGEGDGAARQKRDAAVVAGQPGNSRPKWPQA
jgi:hypothetical protein